MVDEDESHVVDTRLVRGMFADGYCMEGNCDPDVALEKFDSWLTRHDEKQRAELYGLIASLIDDEPCSFDHGGGCQAHGYLYLEQGDICPQQQAKNLLGGA